MYLCASWNASAASVNFSKIVRRDGDSALRITFTSCSVIVEKPRVLPEPVTSLRKARAMPLMSTPDSW